MISQVSEKLAKDLLEKWAKGEDCGLIHESISYGKKRKLKSFSLYFQNGSEVVRISDHWSDSDYNPNLHQKFKCGPIGRNRLNWSVKGFKMFKYCGIALIAGAMNSEYYFSIEH